jgi:hypothetical protein
MQEATIRERGCSGDPELFLHSTTTSAPPLGYLDSSTQTTATMEPAPISDCALRISCCVPPPPRGPRAPRARRPPARARPPRHMGTQPAHTLVHPLRVRRSVNLGVGPAHGAPRGLLALCYNSHNMISAEPSIQLQQQYHGRQSQLLRDIRGPPSSFVTSGVRDRFRQVASVCPEAAFYASQPPP